MATGAPARRHMLFAILIFYQSIVCRVHVHCNTGTDAHVFGIWQPIDQQNIKNVYIISEMWMKIHSGIISSTFTEWQCDSYTCTHLHHRVWNGSSLTQTTQIPNRLELKYETHAETEHTKFETAMWHCDMHGGHARDHRLPIRQFYGFFVVDSIIMYNRT